MITSRDQGDSRVTTLLEHQLLVVTSQSLAVLIMIKWLWWNIIEMWAISLFTAGTVRKDPYNGKYLPT